LHQKKENKFLFLTKKFSGHQHSLQNTTDSQIQQGNNETGINYVIPVQMIMVGTMMPKKVGQK
jgi:hypothetical protein